MRTAVLIVLSGCGRVAFDPHADSRVDDAAVLGAFGTPSVQTALNSGADDDATLSADLLEIIFDSARNGTASNLFTASRATPASPWSTPVVIPELVFPSDEDHPNLSEDGLTLTFSSTRTGGPGPDDLYITTRPDRGSPWGTVSLIPNVCSTAPDFDISMTGDQLFAIFVSSRGSTDRDVWASTRGMASDIWDAPSLVSELSSPQNEEDIMVSYDGLTVVLTSNRGGDYDLYIATRASRSEPFSSPVPISELNTASDELDPWLSPDRRTLAFTRGMGTMRDLYIATR